MGKVCRKQACLVLACEIFGKNWTRRRILFETDNDAVAKVGKSWLPKDPHLVKLMRVLASLAIKHSFELKIIHKAGALNTKADQLSRGRVQDFKRENPSVNLTPTPFSEDFLTFLLSPN